MPPQYDEPNDKQNILSNLPLLFAAGYPTSLEKITERQLERFIPFMVQCSLGYVQLSPANDFAQPEWWPEDVKLMKPFRKPDNFTGDWFAKLKEMVVMCYKHHNCVFLLRFCNQLARYELASLRFINNHNSTTSLFHRADNKLLVTFRNENMVSIELSNGLILIALLKLFSLLYYSISLLLSSCFWLLNNIYYFFAIVNNCWIQYL